MNFFVVGKLDSWEWDSGARDMSPVPKSIARNARSGRYEDDDKVGACLIIKVVFGSMKSAICLAKKKQSQIISSKGVAMYNSPSPFT